MCEELYLNKIYTDKDWVIQVLVNLVSNSLKFIKEGHIHIKAMKNENNIVFQVHDSGPGITEDDQKLLFKMFSKLSATHDWNKTGCGLGLTICK